MKTPLLYLLRHGQTVWNAAGRFQGHMNSDLTVIGQNHAATQGRLLSSVFNEFPNIDVYGSPLGRVRQTAQIALAAHNRTPVLRDDLKEISVGDWEGVARHDIEAGWPDLFNASQTSLELSISAPNGEGYDALYERCQRFLRCLKGPSVVFSHGITISFMRSIVRGLPFEELAQLNNLQGCIYFIKDGQETILSE